MTNGRENRTMATKKAAKKRRRPPRRKRSNWPSDRTQGTRKRPLCFCALIHLRGASAAPRSAYRFMCRADAVIRAERSNADPGFGSNSPAAIFFATSATFCFALLRSCSGERCDVTAVPFSRLTNTSDAGRSPMCCARQGVNGQLQALVWRPLVSWACRSCNPRR